MNNERIDAALALLAPHITTYADPLEVRAVIEDLYDGAQTDLMNSLRTREHAAAQWGVSSRRAVAHITALHERHGVGWQIGGSGMWVIKQADIDRYPPDRKYRRKEER